MISLLKRYCLFLILSFVAHMAVANEGEEGLHVIQFSGILMDVNDSLTLPGAHLYVPSTRRGTTTNAFGYFSFPLVAGDTVRITYVGYKKSEVIAVPDNPNDESLKLAVYIELDTTFLPTVNVFPFPTEEVFKNAVLTVQLPDQEEFNNMERNLNDDLLIRIAMNMPMDGSMNHTYYMNQYVENLPNKYSARYNPLLNPFAWMQFLESVKRGDLKRRK